MKKSNTLGALKKTTYTPLSIQQELAQNLRAQPCIMAWNVFSYSYFFGNIVTGIG